MQGAHADLKLRNGLLALDATDLMILRALEEDSRQAYVTIGHRLGIAHSTVYDRIKKMERHGIIKKYTALVDLEKTGGKTITAIMTVYTDPKESEKVAEELCKAPETQEVYMSISDELQIIAKVTTDTQECLHEFIANSVAPLAGVLRIRTSMVTKKFKETHFSITDSLRVNTYKRNEII